MNQSTLTKSDLRQFTGTEQWHRHGIARNVLYTDGAQYVAESGGAYWLLDEIAFAQSIRDVAAEAFQVWKLKVNPDHTAQRILAGQPARPRQLGRFFSANP